MDTYPRAILHIDGDCFFAACEVARNPKLKGKPVVIGKERSMVTALTYEAKARGITRCMRISEAKKVCPEVVVIESDYETYCIYSQRMASIVRRYTPEVEEYSIDECFAELTGQDEYFKTSYEEIVRRIKHDLDTELGMTFSLGLSTTKVLAKIGSKWQKPSGLTCIPLSQRYGYLKELPIGNVWGIGSQTAFLLNRFGVKTAHDFVSKSEEWVEKNLAKPYLEIWKELNGESVLELNLEHKDNYQSISKTRTFTPPSRDKSYIYSQLSKNIEDACMKLRRHHLASKNLYFFIKTQDFKYQGLELRLPHLVCTPQEILKIVEEKFDQVYKPNTLYRATGINLNKLTKNHIVIDLFGESNDIEKINTVYGFVDSLSHKFGRHAVFLGSSFKALGIAPQKHAKRHLGIPVLGEVN